MLTPNEISSKKFERALGFGYRIDDVEAFLAEAAGAMRALEEEKKDLEKKLEIVVDKLNEYREDEESLRTALLGAQKLGDSVIRESKTKAEIIMRDATIKADTMVDNARKQIEREQHALESLKKEVASFKNRLLNLYKQHLELITGLPGEEEDLPAAEEGQEEEPPVDTSAAGVEMPQPEPEEEDFSIDEEPAQKPAAPESKFGALQFGDGYNLHRQTVEK